MSVNCADIMNISSVFSAFTNDIGASIPCNRVTHEGSDTFCADIRDLLVSLCSLNNRKPKQRMKLCFGEQATAAHFIRDC